MIRERIRQGLAQLRSADLYSSFAAPVLIGISMLICLFAFFALENVVWWEPLAAGATGGVVLVAVLWVIDRTVRRNRQDQPTSSTLLLLLVIFATVARAVVTNGMMWFLADVQLLEPDLAVRVFSGVLQIGFWIVVTALVIARIAEQRTQQTVLLATQTAQLSIKRDSATRLNNEASEFRDTVQRRIVPALWQIHGQLSQLAQRTANVDAGELAAQVRAICDVEVRQVSHLLASRTDEVSAQLDLQPANSAAWALGQSLQRPRFYPLWSFVVAMLLTLPISIYRGGWLGLLGVIPGLVVTYAIARLLDKATFFWFGAQGWRLVFVQLAHLLIFSGLNGIAIYATPLAAEYPRLSFELLWMFPLNLLIVWLLMNIFFGSIQELERITAEVQAENAKLNATIDGLEHEHRALRLTRAQLLHGPVQGRLAAVSLALTMHSQNSSQELIDSARDQLDEARRELVEALRAPVRHATEAREHPFRDLLLAAAEQWDGLLEVEIVVTDAVEDHLAGDAVLTEAAVEAARECLVNSVRHGRARHAQLHFSCEQVEGASRLVLEVVDDGKVNPVAAGLSGFGGTSLRAAGATREISPVEGGTRVRIVWPARVTAGV